MKPLLSVAEKLMKETGQERKQNIPTVSVLCLLCHCNDDEIRKAWCSVSDSKDAQSVWLCIPLCFTKLFFNTLLMGIIKLTFCGKFGFLFLGQQKLRLVGLSYNTA